MPSLKSNIFWNMVRVASNLLFPLITFPYASRILGPDSIGVFNYILAIASYFILFASFGFPIYGMREIAVVRHDVIKQEQTVNSIFTACMLFAVTATAIYLILCYFILKENFVLAAVIGISILLSSISFEWFFQGIEDFRYLTIRGVFVKSISAICLFIFVRDSSDLLAYGILNVAATCGNNILNLIRIRKYSTLRLQSAGIVKHIKGASVMFMGTVAISFYSYMNDILVGALTDMESVGFFSTSNKIVHIVLSVIASITVSIVPRMSNLVGTGNSIESARLQKTTITAVLHVIIPIFVGLFLLSRPAIMLFAGSKFLPAVPALRILSLLIVIIPLSSFLGNQILIPNRKEKYGNYAVISGAVVNVCLALLLIPRFSFLGVAVSLVIAETVVTSVHFYYARKFMLLKAIDFIPFKVIIASLIMGSVIVCLNHFDTRPSISIVWTIIGALSYLLILIMLKDSFTHSLVKSILKLR